MHHRSKKKDKKATNIKQQKITSIVIYIFYKIVDAFVALGGHVDKSGAVSKTALIETIKR